MNNEKYSVIELFAGAGGLALGFEQADFKHVLLNEQNKACCKTLRGNRPDWPILEQDITTVDFTKYQNEIDVVAGGFPCQAFSMAGKRQGFSDERGQMFFQFARVIDEIKPKIFVGENVKGLSYHDKGKTLDFIVKHLSSLGYRVLTPTVLKAMYYDVPQKRERLFIIGIRDDIETDFIYPEPNDYVYTLQDALKAGPLYTSDVPLSDGFEYSLNTKKVLDLVPPGRNWRSLPLAVQKSYLGDWLGVGSNSQVAKRLAWDAPCQTLLKNPASKRIDRCHPDETRPFRVRECARIQTFPDTWEFIGSRSAQYAQIGNAVPVNLAKAIAKSTKICLEAI